MTPWSYAGGLSVWILAAVGLWGLWRLALALVYRISGGKR